jgi:hypothetical protein
LDRIDREEPDAVRISLLNAEATLANLLALLLTAISLDMITYR